MVTRKKEVGLNIIGIIHARGGSRRVPLKNIRPLNGKPLVSYMIQSALESQYLQRVLVSTDHLEIKRISMECGAEVPFLRPAKLAEDCPSEWVTQHAVEFIEANGSQKIDMAVTLQPTTPFCRAEDIDACVEILIQNKDLNSVFSAKSVHTRPEWMFTVQEKPWAKPFLDGEMKGERGIVQSLPPLVMPNGAVYATRRETLFNEGVLISRQTGVHIMPPERSVDIDEPIDFLYAEFLIGKGVSP